MIRRTANRQKIKTTRQRAAKRREDTNHDRKHQSGLAPAWRPGRARRRGMTVPPDYAYGRDTTAEFVVEHWRARKERQS